MTGPGGPVLRDAYTRDIAHTFQPSFGVQGLPQSREVPALTVAGRPGAIPQPNMAREDVRHITVAGSLYADGGTTSQRQDAIQSELDTILQHIGPSRELLLCESSASERGLPVYYRNLIHTYVPKTNRTVAQVRFVFEAFNPFWYAFALVSEQATFGTGGGFIDVENVGSSELHPILWISGAAAFEVENVATGITFAYAGDPGAQAVVVDSFRQTVQLFSTAGAPGSFVNSDKYSDLYVPMTGTNAIQHAGTQFIVYAFPMVSGVNRLALNKAGTVGVVFVPRWR